MGILIFASKFQSLKTSPAIVLNPLKNSASTLSRFYAKITHRFAPATRRSLSLRLFLIKVIVLPENFLPIDRQACSTEVILMKRSIISVIIGLPNSSLNYLMIESWTPVWATSSNVSVSFMATRVFRRRRLLNRILSMP